MIFRFAVGAPGEARSSTWRLWSCREDIYLVQRSHGGIHKFSFHKSGICRWALIQEPRSGRDRAMVKWTELRFHALTINSPW